MLRTKKVSLWALASDSLTYTKSHKILLSPVNCYLSFPYLLQEDPLGLDSCWASSRIFSMSPLWIEEDEGTCSSPPARLSSSSFCKACRGCGGSVSPWFLLATEAARLGISCCLPGAMFPFNSNSTQDPEEPTKLSIVMKLLTLKFTVLSPGDWNCVIILKTFQGSTC